MMVSRSRLLVATLALSGFVVSLPSTAGASSTTSTTSTTTSNPLVRPHQFAPHGAPRGSTALGAVPGTQRLNLSVVLPPSNTAALRSLLANLYNPSSPQFHHWLQPGQFATAFGPSSSDVATVESWLRGRGLSSTLRSGSAIKVSAPVSEVSAALGTSFERYRLRSGQVGYLAHDAPLVPDNLAHGQVASILGLNTLTDYRPESLKSVPSDHPTSNASLQPKSDGLNPCPGATTALANFGNGASLDQIGASYGIGSLLNDNQNGHGETIGLYELAPHSASDVSSYLNCFGLANSVTTVPVDGGSGSFFDPSGQVEADLDIEQVATQAPGASIVSYEGPNSNTGVYDVWSKIVTDDVAQVVSTSWGECEAIALQGGMSGGFSSLFTQAAAQGQSIFAATGDSGSEDCYPSDGSTSLAVDYPASDPGVTAVGGTTLGSNSQVVWNDCQTQESSSVCGEQGVTGATGGGVSTIESRQNGQPAVNVPAEVTCLNGCREVPDVSANAGTPMEIYCLEAGCNGGWTFARGTSFASPFWAGLEADRSEGCTSQTGLFNPALYALYSQGAYGTAFTDIKSGDNDLIGGTNVGQYPALNGYDLASGIGSPIAGGLSCPEVTSVTPGQSGHQVVVTGLGLEHATVDFGSSAASVVPGTASATAVTVVVPSGSGTVTVGGTSALGTGTNTVPFTYPAITTTSLAAGVVGQPYSQTLAAVGVSAQESWTATPGSLPGGLTLNASNGVISGTPTTASPSQNVSITLTADQGTVLTATLPIRIFSSASTTTATATPSNSNLGRSVTFGADVTSSTGTPTGTVTFSIGSVSLCTTPALVSGVGSCASSAAPAGSNTVTAIYSDDGTFAPSTGSTSLEVADGPYNPIGAVRICDTRPNNPSNLISTTGAQAAQCNGGSGNPGSTLTAGGTKSIIVAGDFGVPSNATAVVLNVTVVNPTAPGYLSVYAKGATQPMASNIDYVTGQVVPNLVEVGTGTAGEVTFYASMPADIVVDVEGYTSVAAAGLYTSLPNPVRICDTRAGDPSTLDSPPVNQCNGANNVGETLAAGGTKDIQVTGISTIPAGATAAVLNVTVANPGAPGYLTAYPQGGGTTPTASNLDYLAGQVTANRVIVPLSAGGLFTVYSSARADVVVDVSGYYASGSGTEFNAEPTPVRICDTRPNNPSNLSGSSRQCNGAPLNPGQSRIVNVSSLAGVPSTARAVVVNLTGVSPSAPTFLTVFASSLPSPLVSDLDEVSGDVRANMAVATLSSTGTMTIFNDTGSIDVVVDVLGWYS
jgi:hypothetical protein